VRSSSSLPDRWGNDESTSKGGKKKKGSGSSLTYTVLFRRALLSDLEEKGVRAARRLLSGFSSIRP